MMDKKNRQFELLCDVAVLMQAWKQVRSNRGAAGVDRVSLAEYEHDLVANLEDLAARISEGRYFPMPLRRFQMEKPNGKMRSLGIFTIEDRIAQRAALNLLEPLWEASFLECSYGFRPGRNVEMAVKQALDYRAMGDCYVVDADIADCFASLDHELIMKAVSERVRDKRMLNLIRMWLSAGQVFAASSQMGNQDGEPPAIERLTGYATDAITHLLDERGYGVGYGGYNSYSGHSAYGTGSEPDGSYGTDDNAQAVAEARKAARRDVYKRMGRDAFLLGLTFVGRRGSLMRLLSPTTLALGGAAALATAAYPAASRFVRKQMGQGTGQVGAVQGSPLSALLCNIVLHQFDLEMTRAGYRLIRYADDFIITTRTEAEAQAALALAGRKLTGLRLQLNPDKTRIIRFERGLDFLGYKFDPFLLTATPPPTATQPPIKLLLSKAPAAMAELRDKAAPQLTRIAQFGKQAADRAKQQAARASGYFKRKGQ